MRVLQFGKFYPPAVGGIETIMRTLTVGLNDHGVKTDVLCSNSTCRTEISDADGYRIIRAASLGKVFSTSVSPALISWLFKVQHTYDLIHAHMPDPLVIVALLACRSHPPIVLQWHGDIDFNRFKWLGKVYRPLDRLLVRRSDRVVGATDAHILYSAHRDLFTGKSEVIPFPLDPRFADAQRDPSDTTLRELTRGKFVVFSVGRLIYYKGFEYLISAASDLPDDCLVMIAGSGPLHATLQSQITRLDLAHKVKLIGRLSDESLLDYYAACDVFCFPSIYRGEMFGMAQLEAMSFGKPVVSTDIPGSGVTHVNVHNVTGTVVPIRDPHALARAILALKNDAARYSRYSAAARSRALDGHGCASVIPRYVELYSRLLTQSR